MSPWWFAYLASLFLVVGVGVWRERGLSPANLGMSSSLALAIAAGGFRAQAEGWGHLAPVCGVAINLVLLVVSRFDPVGLYRRSLARQARSERAYQIAEQRLGSNPAKACKRDRHSACAGLGDASNACTCACHRESAAGSVRWKA